MIFCQNMYKHYIQPLLIGFLSGALIVAPIHPALSQVPPTSPSVQEESALQEAQAIEVQPEYLDSLPVLESSGWDLNELDLPAYEWDLPEVQGSVPDLNPELAAGECPKLPEAEDLFERISDLSHDIQQNYEAACCQGVPGVQLTYTTLEDIAQLIEAYQTVKHDAQEYINGYFDQEAYDNIPYENLESCVMESKFIMIAQIMEMARKIVLAQMYLGKTLDDLKDEGLSQLDLSIDRGSFQDMTQEEDSRTNRQISGSFIFEEDKGFIHIKLHPRSLIPLQMDIEMSEHSRSSRMKFILSPILQIYYDRLLEIQRLRGVVDPTPPDVSHLVQGGYFSFSIASRLWEDAYKRSLERNFRKALLESLIALMFIKKPSFDFMTLPTIVNGERPVLLADTIKYIDDIFTERPIDPQTSESLLTGVVLNPTSLQGPPEPPVLPSAWPNGLSKDPVELSGETTLSRHWPNGLSREPIGPIDTNQARWNLQTLNEYIHPHWQGMRLLSEEGASAWDLEDALRPIPKEMQDDVNSFSLQSAELRYFLFFMELQLLRNGWSTNLRCEVLDQDCLLKLKADLARIFQRARLEANSYFLRINIDKHNLKDANPLMGQDMLNIPISDDNTGVCDDQIIISNDVGESCEIFTTWSALENASTALRNKLQISPLLDEWIVKATHMASEYPEKRREAYIDELIRQSETIASISSADVETYSTLETYSNQPDLIYKTLEKQKDFQISPEAQRFIDFILSGASYQVARTNFTATMASEIRKLTKGQVTDIYQTDMNLFVDPLKIETAFRRATSLQTDFSPSKAQHRISRRALEKKIQILNEVMDVGRDMGFLDFPDQQWFEEQIEAIAESRQVNRVISSDEIKQALQPIRSSLLAGQSPAEGLTTLKEEFRSAREREQRAKRKALDAIFDWPIADGDEAQNTNQGESTLEFVESLFTSWLGGEQDTNQDENVGEEQTPLEEGQDTGQDENTLEFAENLFTSWLGGEQDTNQDENVGEAAAALETDQNTNQIEDTLTGTDEINLDRQINQIERAYAELLSRILRYRPTLKNILASLDAPDAPGRWLCFFVPFCSSNTDWYLEAYKVFHQASLQDQHPILSRQITPYSFYNNQNEAIELSGLDMLRTDYQYDREQPLFQIIAERCDEQLGCAINVSELVERALIAEEEKLNSDFQAIASANDPSSLEMALQAWTLNGVRSYLSSNFRMLFDFHSKHFQEDFAPQTFWQRFLANSKYQSIAGNMITSALYFFPFIIVKYLPRLTSMPYLGRAFGWSNYPIFKTFAATGEDVALGFFALSLPAMFYQMGSLWYLNESIQDRSDVAENLYFASGSANSMVDTMEFMASDHVSSFSNMQRILSPVILASLLLIPVFRPMISRMFSSYTRRSLTQLQFHLRKLDVDPRTFDWNMVALRQKAHQRIAQEAHRDGHGPFAEYLAQHIEKSFKYINRFYTHHRRHFLQVERHNLKLDQALGMPPQGSYLMRSGQMPQTTTYQQRLHKLFQGDHFVLDKYFEIEKGMRSGGSLIHNLRGKLIREIGDEIPRTPGF